MAFLSDSSRWLPVVLAAAIPLTSSAADDGNAKPPATKKEAAASAVALKKFLHSTDGTYGWEPVKAGGDGLSYDFFPDGRLHIQGADGEATMWEGKWLLEGNNLTMTNSTKKTKKTVTATADGKELLLDNVRYRRYKPQ